MAAQARQVFYVQDLCESRWSVVLQGRTTSIGHLDFDDSILDVNKLPAFSKQMPLINVEDDKDDAHTTRNDQDDGLWENIPT